MSVNTEEEIDDCHIEELILKMPSYPYLFRLLKLLRLTGHFYTACLESRKKWMMKCFILHGH